MNQQNCIRFSWEPAEYWSDNRVPLSVLHHFTSFRTV